MPLLFTYDEFHDHMEQIRPKMLSFPVGGRIPLLPSQMTVSPMAMLKAKVHHWKLTEVQKDLLCCLGQV